MAHDQTIEPKIQAAQPAPIPRRYTYAQLQAEMPQSNGPAELWDGELIMSPAPSFHHQKVALRFYKALDRWVGDHALGEVIAAPIDMVLSQHRTMQPDVAFIAAARLGIIQDAIIGPADLVAEVVSLGTRNRDRIEKRDLYEQYGVKEYWIIDPEAESVDVLHLQDNVLQLSMRCHVDGIAQSRLLSGFEISLKHLFHGR